MSERKKRAFSGVKPSGEPHLGNYLGAIRNWVATQADYENIFCIVDLHAVTVYQDPAELSQRTLNLAALYLACGLDPQICTVFVQSHIHEHAELAWLLNCITPIGWLNRMTQFKAKAGSNQEQASTGLYSYPVLMAADILLYQADVVPVGDDQRQHVELTRDIAERFNRLYGKIFEIPTALIRDLGARIMSLDNPTAKMSKSDPGSYIAITDPPDIIYKKLAHATTDSEHLVTFDPQRPGVYNLLSIYELLTDNRREEIEQHFAGKGYRELKSELADMLIAQLEPIQQRYHALLSDLAHLRRVLDEGAVRARPIAQATLSNARTKMGM
jgi:tryptophanyl-tRNA synthetase